MLCVKSLLILNPWIVPRWPWRVAKGALKAPPPSIITQGSNEIKPTCLKKREKGVKKSEGKWKWDKSFFQRHRKIFPLFPEKKIEEGKKII